MSEAFRQRLCLSVPASGTHHKEHWSVRQGGGLIPNALGSLEILGTMVMERAGQAMSQTRRGLKRHQDRPYEIGNLSRAVVSRMKERQQ